MWKESWGNAWIPDDGDFWDAMLLCPIVAGENMDLLCMHAVFHSPFAPAVSRETLARLDVLVQLLRKWNRTVNLVASADPQVVWSKHIEDSLRMRPLIPPSVTEAVDLGSGAGFPGLVLALACDIRFHLIESDHRKAGFLLEAARMTGAPVQVHCARIENAACNPAALVTARALAPLPALLDYAETYLLPGGTCLFPKGKRADNEIESARLQWSMVVEKFRASPAVDSVVLRLTKLSRVHRDT